MASECKVYICSKSVLVLKKFSFPPLYCSHDFSDHQHGDDSTELMTFVANFIKELDAGFILVRVR